MLLKNNKILILGANGFIGGSLDIFLRTRGYKIIKYSKSDGNNLLSINKFISYLKNKKPKIIINCAAVHGSLKFVMENPAKIIYQNLQILINIYESIRKSNLKNVTVINPVANCSYSAIENVQKEINWWNGIPHESSISFGSTRRMVQVVSDCYQKQYLISSKNFLLPGVYGPNNHLDDKRLHALDGLILRMVKAKKNNLKTFKIWGTGKPIREWCFIDDVIKFIYILITNKKKIESPINLGQKKGYSIRQLANQIKKTLQYKGKLFFDETVADGARIKVLDNKNFKKFFPNFKFTQINKGIKKSINYYLKEIN
jgi:GDP-L-fucose synthase